MALIGYGAQGDTAAIAANTLGGLFHLTDEEVDGGGYRAFVVDTRTLKVLEGVWTWDDEGVIIKWDVGESRHYEWDVWKPNMAVLNRIRKKEQQRSQENKDGNQTGT